MQHVIIYYKFNKTDFFLFLNKSKLGVNLELVFRNAIKKLSVQCEAKIICSSSKVCNNN